ncbi:MAG: dihydroorotase, partial [Desulfobacterales bacterium]
MLTWIKGGRTIDPGNIDDVRDLLIEDGKIAAIVAPGTAEGAQLAARSAEPATRVIDATGKIITPGLIDMHVHLREPGFEHKETIESGCRAAAWGGFTALCPMPNTNPANDSREITEYVLAQAAQNDTVPLYPVAAISKGLAGRGLCDYRELKTAGAVAISDDGNPVMDSQLMRKALEYAQECGLLVISHCEDLNLTAGGVMNEGVVARQLGLGGIPNASESIMVMRDIALAELIGTRVHIAHVSTAESVRAIREAKARGVEVTAETAPHYFMLTDEAVKEYGSNAKMNPPLRANRDREAIRQGLADGTIDVIATDHAPHAPAEKAVGLERAPNGIIGLETSVSLGIRLVNENVITLGDLVAKMSTNPARILGLARGLRVGLAADLTIIDPAIAFTVDANTFQSRSRNTPFDGWHLRGKPFLTMVAGR